MPRKTPSYRQRKGYDQAIVTLTDARTRKRRDYWLGEFGTPESRERYHRIIAEWEANDRRLPEPPDPTDQDSQAITIVEIAREYWRWAQSYYTASETANVRSALRVLHQFFGTTPAEDFGPKRLRLVREAMVTGDANIDLPRRPWSRPHVNKQVHRLCAMFKWAAAREMIPASVYHQLKAVEPLKRGRTVAHEPEPVGPVPDAMVDAIRPFISRQVWALIQLQRLVGARGGELFKLRPIDLNMDRETGVWTYSPSEHKTAHHGKQRTIYFGPRAQAVIEPFLADRPAHAYLFSPAEAEAERREQMHASRTTPLSWGNRPGTNRKSDVQRSPGEHYTADSYRRAIQRACDMAYPPPEQLRRAKVKGLKGWRKETEEEWRHRLGAEQWAGLLAWQREHRWHPHQLRHTAGTEIRRRFGLEAAQLALGHSSAQVTDAVYAERDAARVIEMMKQIG